MLLCTYKNNQTMESMKIVRLKTYNFVNYIFA